MKPSGGLSLGVLSPTFPSMLFSSAAFLILWIEASECDTTIDLLLISDPIRATTLIILLTFLSVKLDQHGSAHTSRDPEADAPAPRPTTEAALASHTAVLIPQQIDAPNRS